MNLFPVMRTVVFLSLLSAITQFCSANPVLSTTTWTNITPSQSQVGKVADVFCQGMAIDPNNPSTLYLCVCAFDVQYGGLYKKTDAGSKWTKVGNLDEPVHVVVDPKNSNHLYCVDGVRGNTIGLYSFVVKTRSDQIQVK